MKRFVPSLAALALALPCGLLAQPFYLASKSQIYFQTSVVAATPQPYPFAMSFTSPSANQVTGPSGTFTIPFGSGQAQLQRGYHTQAALDAAFPNGNYTFVGPPSYSTALTGDLYPSSVPQVVGGSGTWTNGVLVVDPTQDTVLQFSTFSTYSSGAGGHEKFTYSAQDNSGIGASQDVISFAVGPLPASPQPFTTYTIPKNTLKVGGLYQAQLQFDAASGVDTTSIPGGGVLSFYSRITQIYIIGRTANPPAAPTLNPVANISGVAGSLVTVAVTGTGLGSGVSTPFWFHNGSQLDFSTGRYGILNGASLTIPNFSAADAGGYYVIVVGPGGLVISNEASVTVSTPPPPVTVPVITAQPQPVNIVGGTAVFNVSATGTGLTYQWYRNGLLLGGANTSRLLLQNVTASASYYCVISNSAGAATTNPTALTIVNSTSQVSRLINESVLSNVPTGGSLTVGYYVGGPGASSAASQSLLIRGDGPTLGALLGSGGTMADPNLKVIPQGTQTAIAANDNWGANQAQIIAADAATGAFPLLIGSLDAALVSNFTAGGYSAIVSPNTTGGSVLAELYDNTSAGSYSATSPHLINLSVIAPVSGGGTLSAGFVVSGSTSRTVLIRAMGPALSTFGLAGLPDPTLTLVLQSSGVLVASNQGWGGDPLVSAIAASVNGFPFASATSLDSALLVTVSPGVTYTATAASASGASGQVLIEVYDVP